MNIRNTTDYHNFEMNKEIDINNLSSGDLLSIWKDMWFIKEGEWLKTLNDRLEKKYSNDEIKMLLSFWIYEQSNKEKKSLYAIINAYLKSKKWKRPSVHHSHDAYHQNPNKVLKDAKNFLNKEFIEKNRTNNSNNPVDYMKNTTKTKVLAILDKKSPLSK